nr:immunoglobulin heavy chain junction region [Macaca mulatta]MPN83868.1 immunoglobulin heavy chain junction region [Macaca mulatta]MPN83876.1 immunoglobulin heavy chain junction region [Macaca mulatta]MPN83906.1 immunoglobulin heavy chain junction region [Macaca mulatta]MPN83910.1 immunoglobulin heavy chain junction region [Macaca mulatta]
CATDGGSYYYGLDSW